jgi:hypothetical protein
LHLPASDEKDPFALASFAGGSESMERETNTIKYNKTNLLESYCTCMRIGTEETSSSALLAQRVAQGNGPGKRSIHWRGGAFLAAVHSPLRQSETEEGKEQDASSRYKFFE